MARPRLSRRLHNAIGNGLTIVEGPPGCGKTVLLAQFAGDIDFAVRWLTLDPSCLYPEVLASRIARTVLQDLNASEPAFVNDISNLRAYLGNTLHSVAKESRLPLLLILDGYHEVAESDDARELLSWLVRQLPADAEVIITSRTPVDFPGVSERIFAGETEVISVNDLVFTEEETAALAETYGRGEDAGPIHTTTGGWPIAVIACLRGALKSSNDHNVEIGEAWQTYLVREIWNGLDESVRDSLLAVSVAPVIDAQIAIGLIGQHAWWQLADWLSTQDLLVERLAGQSARLNPVFRTFLAERYQRVDPAGYERSLRIVVEWLESGETFADAVLCALAGRHYELLAEVVRRRGAALIRQGSTSPLVRAFSALPPRILNASPDLRAIHARVISYTGDPAQVLTMADSVITTPGIDAMVRHNAVMARCRALRQLGRAREMGPILPLYEDEADELMLAEMYFNDAEYEAYGKGNYTTALDLLEVCVGMASAAGVRSLELLARGTIGQFLAMRGDAPAAIAELTQVAQGWRTLPGAASWLCWSLNNLGMSHLSVGDFESAVDVLQEAVDQGSRCGNPRNLAYARASLAESRVAQGEYTAALTDYEQVLKICSEVADGTLACLLLIGYSAAALGAGDTRQADYLAREAYVLAESLGVPTYIAQANQQIAMVLLAVGDTQSALLAQQDAVARLNDTEAKTELLVARYRLALCLFKAHKRMEAAKIIEQVDEMLTEPWMAGPLIPAAREHPMFAQWACSRRNTPAFRFLAERGVFARASESGAAQSPYPKVIAESLGHMRVMVGDHEVQDEAWNSSRAKELFFLLLANRNGIRKEDAVLKLYPDIEPEKTNSIFHSNLHRVRKALYQEAVIKKDGAYLLNPEGSWEWDVDKFEEAMNKASRHPAGSAERAQAHEHALSLYGGPFAEQFYSEWAETVRRRVDQRTCEAIALLAGFQAGQRRFEDAAITLERLLAIDEDNLDAMFHLAVYRARSGNTAVALKFLDTCKARWAQEYSEPLPDRFNRLRLDIAAGRAV